MSEEGGSIKTRSGNRSPRNMLPMMRNRKLRRNEHGGHMKVKDLLEILGGCPKNPPFKIFLLPNGREHTTVSTIV